MYVNVPWTDTTYNFSGTTFYSGNSNTAEHDANNAIKNGMYYYTSNGPSISLETAPSDGALYVQSYSDYRVAQIAQDYKDGRLFVRGINNGAWQPWKKIAITEDFRPDKLFGYASNPDDSHPGDGARVFYSWGTGQANNATSGYSTGITIGSNPFNTNSGFQIVQNIGDDRTYTRRYDVGWKSWKTLAWTSDIPTS
ncbi:MAG: pyocin knob domain-containing protein, partial [Bacteroidales bacterium]|nr:pyocin knob domain-containing protein [Bacteroidales bacterium]